MPMVDVVYELVQVDASSLNPNAPHPRLTAGGVCVCVLQIGLGPAYGRLTASDATKMYSSRNDEEDL